jgi:hypothetical protein
VREPRLSRRDLALVLAVPLLLVVVALVQQVRVRTQDQSSWHGTGFGMFATFDSLATRTLVAHTVPGGDPVAITASDAAGWARLVPSDANARRAAEEIARHSSLPPGTRLVVEVRAVRVETRANEIVVTPVVLASASVTVGANPSAGP